MEVFGPRMGGRAMGYYLSALVAGGLLGRVGVALAAAAVGWRAPLVALALLPAASAVVMWRTLPDAPPQPAGLHGRRAAARLLRNRQVLAASGAGAGAFLAFVGVFSYVPFRLESPAVRVGPTRRAASSSCCGSSAGSGRWPGGSRTASAGARWRWPCSAAWRPACCSRCPPRSSRSCPALALITAGMFSGVTAAQIGIATASESDRGTATAIYFSLYYAAGAAGGYLPGLAWEAWDWPGVAAVALAGLAVALALLAAHRAPAPEQLPA